MATFKQYTLKNGSKKWMFKTYLGIDEVTGKQITTTRRRFRTRKEAVLAERRLQHEIMEGVLLSAKKAKTFKEVATSWLGLYKNTVKQSTYTQTMIMFNEYIYPKFGTMKIDKIDTNYCQKAINDWHKKAVRKNYPLLLNYVSKVFKFAINSGIVKENPTLNVIIPKRKENASELKLKYYTKDQLELFLSTVQQEDDSYLRTKDYALFRLLAFSGCRIGEILALTWSDLNFEDNSLRVNKTVTKATKHYISKQAKTKKSNRIIPLDDRTMHSLKIWKVKQRERIFMLGFTKPAFIFSNNKNSFTIAQSVMLRLAVYQKAAALPKVTLHAFRHTHASLLFEAGASVKEVSERLGHSDIKTTMNIYTHVSDQQKEKTVDKLMSYAQF